MTVLLSLFPGVDLWGHAFELEWPDACVVRGPDPIFGSLSDIRKFHPPPGVFAGLFGGPPCQSFSSLVHLVRANGHEPRFGNLIPEFERCVHEGQPDWFCMENVPAAPKPAIAGYGVNSFLLNNSWLLAAGGFGQEQERKRMFTFGVKGREAPNLMKWIDVAALMLPAWARVASTDGATTPSEKKREVKRAVTSSTGGFIDGSKNPKTRHEAVTGGHDKPPSARQRTVICTGGDSERKMRRYKLSDAIRLQGLPEGFLDDAPFTADGKLKAIANGVCMFTGRAIARAIREALTS